MKRVLSPRIETSWQLLPVTLAPWGIWLVARWIALERSQIDSAVTEPARAGASLASSRPAASSSARPEASASEPRRLP
jgi:hypothetical protein